VVDVALNWDEVEDRGGEVIDRAALLVCHVAGHGEGFQVDLGPMMAEPKSSMISPSRFSTDFVKIRKSR